MDYKMDYKSRIPFMDRYNESKRIIDKYPDKIPIICEKDKKYNSDCPNIDKNKYLVPTDLTLGQFIYIIRKRINIPSEKALFVFVNGTIQPNSRFISSLYYNYKCEDGFLYITYSFENTFG
jgi:GABA(A) receptor-associated protein